MSARRHGTLLAHSRCGGPQPRTDPNTQKQSHRDKKSRRPMATLMHDVLASADPEVASVIGRERRRQVDAIELIASENYVSQAVLDAVGSVLTNKYAEGLPGKRYYGGCEFVDEVEVLAIERAKQLFGAEHVNVQPHSGANANLAAYMAFIDAGDRILGLSLQDGGHLSLI